MPGPRRAHRLPALASALALLAAACGSARSQAGAPHDRDAALATAAASTGPSAAGAAWDRAVAEVAAERTRLAAAWKTATGAERAAIRDRASRYLYDAFTTRLLPPWMGMPWGLGRNSTATRPFEPGMTVACSYFVGAVLAGADFRIRDRFRLGQAAALRIQRSLVGGAGKVHRFLSIAPSALAARVAALGDGVYVIGLDVHVGLVVVRAGQAHVVHASYTGDQVVTDEPMASARVIANSRPKGYFVSPVVVADGADDDWLIERWLAGTAVGP